MSPNPSYPALQESFNYTAMEESLRASINSSSVGANAHTTIYTTLNEVCYQYFHTNALIIIAIFAIGLLDLTGWTPPEFTFPLNRYTIRITKQEFYYPLYRSCICILSLMLLLRGLMS